MDSQALWMVIAILILLSIHFEFGPISLFIQRIKNKKRLRVYVTEMNENACKLFSCKEAIEIFSLAPEKYCLRMTFLEGPGLRLVTSWYNHETRFSQETTLLFRREEDYSYFYDFGFKTIEDYLNFCKYVQDYIEKQEKEAKEKKFKNFLNDLEKDALRKRER